MGKRNTVINIPLLIIFCLSSLQIVSQTSVNSTGINIENNKGSISYSIGITSYSSSQTNAFNITEGVQHNFESLLLVDDLSFYFFPNPAEKFINLVFEYDFNKNYYYRIQDVQGRILKKEKLNSYVTSIFLLDMQPGIYFITIYDQVQIFNTKKIIKI